MQCRRAAFLYYVDGMTKLGIDRKPYIKKQIKASKKALAKLNAELQKANSDIFTLTQMISFECSTLLSYQSTLNGLIEIDERKLFAKHHKKQYKKSTRGESAWPLKV